MILLMNLSVLIAAIRCKKLLRSLIVALEKIDKGIWIEKDVLILENIKGKRYKLKYLKKHSLRYLFSIH